MADGYISVYRDIESNWVWRDKPFSRGQAWIDLLMMAQYQDGDFYSNSLHQVIHGKRGCVYRSVTSMAQRWGWSRKKVRHFLGQLEVTGMAHTESTSKGTVVTLVNYDFYQSGGPIKGTTKGTSEGTTKDTTKEQPRNNRGTTEEQPRNTNNKVNKGNKGNKKKTSPLDQYTFSEEEIQHMIEVDPKNEEYFREAMRRQREET